jgi:microcompartment protein CcmL/EutN
MGISIGLLELKSIPIGIQTADEMIKAADVKLLTASPTCPGKYIVIISGQVGAVKSAMAVGQKQAASYLVAHHIINNVHESLPAAILGVTEVEKVAAIGVIETISALAAVNAADVAAKAAKVQMMEIRIARGLGGKGFLVFTGEVSSVRSAVKACSTVMGDTGEIISHCVIPAPHKDLVKQLLAQ